MADYKTGIELIDEVLNDSNNRLIFLNGEQGQGKTALALQIAINLSRNEVAVKYHSLQLDSQDIMIRTLANVSCIKIDSIKSEILSRDNKCLMNSFVTIMRAKMYVDETKDYKVEDLVEAIIQGLEKIPVKLIMVDKFELIQSAEGEEADYFKMAYALKELSRTLSCPLIVINDFIDKRLPKDCFYCPRIPFVADCGISVEIKNNCMTITHRDGNHSPIKTQVCIFDAETLKISSL